MDVHFFNAPLHANIPVLMGLLGVWNLSFLGYTSRTMLPYSEALCKFPAHVQQVWRPTRARAYQGIGSLWYCSFPPTSSRFARVSKPQSTSSSFQAPAPLL